MFHRTKNKDKKWFCKSCLHCFSSESINGKQLVKLEERIIKFENYFKQIKLFVLMINLLNQLLFTEVKMQLMNLLKQFLKNMNIAKKIMKEHFNKNLIMTKEDLFHLDHCHVTAKFRGAAHKSCNLIFKLTRKVPVIFHNLKNS